MAKTGNLFFVPSATFLDGVADGVMPAAPQSSDANTPAPPQPPATGDGSLGIGSLKGDPTYE